MTEDEARQILLVRAVEEEDPEFVLPDVRADAWRYAGSTGDLARFCVRRAAFLLERLPPRVGTLLRFELPPRDLTLVLFATAAALGLASNGLSVDRRIHVLANPVTALLLWNLVVYVALTAACARRSSTAAARTLGPALEAPHASHRPPRSEALAPLRPLLSLIVRCGLLWTRLRARRPKYPARETPAAAARMRLRFATGYAALCAPTILARSERVAHLGAIAFALGALTGIYLQGVAFEYRVEWGSTLVSSPETRASLAALLFLPARLLLGSGFPDASQLALAASPDGAPAAIWFHVFAVSVASVVVLPRSVLGLAAGWRARRLSRAIELPDNDAYWSSVAEPPSAPAETSFARTLLPQFALDADACTVLASLEAALVADDIGSTSSAGRMDNLGRKKNWFERWRLLVDRGFTAFPERERPTLLEPQSESFAQTAARVRAGPNAFSPALVLLELAAFEAYGPLDSRDATLRDRLGLTPSLQRSVRAKSLERASRLLGFPESEGEALRSALGATGRELSGLWSKVAVGAAAGTALGALTLGVAAPVAAGLVGKAVGTAGLVALKTGLGAVGGHVAVGAGLGAAGGTVLVAGGGGLLGVGASGGTPATALEPAGALASGSKIEVFLRRIVAGRHREPETFTAILAELRASVSRLRGELPGFRLDAAHTTKQIREREKVISILDRVAQRNEEWGRRHGIVS